MSGYKSTKILFRVLGSVSNAMSKTTRPPSGSSGEAPEVIDVPYPFVREVVSLPNNDEEGPYSIEVETWRPGTRAECDGAGDMDNVADALGTMRLTVVSRHRPGRYPTRVFFTRRWIDPDGKEFGKKLLRIRSSASFKALTAGYWHPFRWARRVRADAQSIGLDDAGSHGSNGVRDVPAR